MCNLFLDKKDDALSDANAVITLYKEKRPDDESKVVKEDVLNKDPLIQVLSLAYLRKGQVLEAKTQLLDALQEYSLSNALKISDEGQAAMKRVLKVVGIPENFEQTDAQLKPFGMIVLHIISEMNLMASLTALMTYLTENELSDDLIKKINDTGASRVLFGAMQLHMDNEMIVVGCISAARICAEKGIGDVFNGFMIIRIAMEHWKNNANVIGDALRFLRLSPAELIPYLARSDFIPPVCAAMQLPITDDEFEAVYFLLFHLGNTVPQMTQIVSEGVLDNLFEKKNESGFMLLSKLVQMEDVAKQSYNQGAIDWALEYLQTTKENMIIVSSFILLANMLSVVEPPDEKYTAIFDAVWPKIKGASKDGSIVSNGFAVLSMCAEKVKAKIEEQNIINVASALLQVHTNNQIVAQNIISFLYECSVNGMLQTIKNTRPVLPTVMNALKMYPKNRSIVERSVALAVLCDHPNKESLLQAGIIEFPESEILKKYLNIIPINK
ncbi:hypothetical protein GPJ56_004664 [Histomonas meleagridis]|uniref:uncharacterized protein n=1 Tax=Histomonas meleagridis TaxID=135588 RepID=UPI003559F31F|nr:hypothetical protein GPJ56_004664 [Histomonas meleagridis]KAH0797425.1 hypothetical protein GO595_009746 [Histomonas meleagridis]